MTVARHTKQWEKYLASTVLVLFSDLLLLLSWFLLLHRRLVLPLLLKVSLRDAVQTHTQYKCVMLNTHTLYTFSTVLIVLLHTTQSVRIGWLATHTHTHTRTHTHTHTHTLYSNTYIFELWTITQLPFLICGYACMHLPTS